MFLRDQTTAYQQLELAPFAPFTSQSYYHYLIVVWALSYAECINEGVYLEMPTQNEVTGRFTQILRHSQLDEYLAFKKYFAEVYPDLKIFVGLSWYDLTYNAKATIVSGLLGKIQELVPRLETAVSAWEPAHCVLHTHEIKLININAHVKACLKHLKLQQPDFYIGGPDGQAQVLRLIGVEDPQGLLQAWVKKVARHIPHLPSEPTLRSPTDKVGIATHTLSEVALMTASAYAMRLHNLGKFLLYLYHNRILVPGNFGTTEVAIDFLLEQPDYSIISSPIDPGPFLRLSLYLHRMVNFLETVALDPEAARKTYMNQPDCLHEYYAAYKLAVEDDFTETPKLKQTKDYISRMPAWAHLLRHLL